MRAKVEQWLDWNQCRLFSTVVDIVLNSVFLGRREVGLWSSGGYPGCRRFGRFWGFCKSLKKLALLSCVLLTPAMTVAAGPSPECLTKKYSQYAKAQETWQRAVTKLMIEIAPRYKEAAQLYLTDQLWAIEQAKLAVQFLARQEPGKLRTQMSLNNWLSLEGTDRQRIAANDERYSELLELRTAARKRPPHPDGDGLREVMRSEVMTSDKYKELLKTYSQSVQAAEDIQCQAEARGDRGRRVR